MNHLDESGAPCERHGAANPDAILTFALIGSRVTSFNHDLASKLQGVMMALDEIAELTTDPDMVRAADTAQAALKEATTLLSANRQLTRTSPTKSPVREIVETAGKRFGIVVRGPMATAEIDAVIPQLTHALGLAFDAVAGTGRDRTLDVTSTHTDKRITLVFATPAAPSKTAGDALAIAASAVERAGGTLRCGQDRLTIALPTL